MQPSADLREVWKRLGAFHRVDKWYPIGVGGFTQRDTMSVRYGAEPGYQDTLEEQQLSMQGCKL